MPACRARLAPAGAVTRAASASRSFLTVARSPREHQSSECRWSSSAPFTRWVTYAGRNFAALGSSGEAPSCGAPHALPLGGLADRELGDGHAGDVEAVFDQVAAGALDHAGSDGASRR